MNAGDHIIRRDAKLMEYVERKSRKATKADEMLKELPDASLVVLIKSSNITQTESAELVTRWRKERGIGNIPKSAKTATNTDSDVPNVASGGAAFPEIIVWTRCSIVALATNSRTNSHQFSRNSR